MVERVLPKPQGVVQGVQVELSPRQRLVQGVGVVGECLSLAEGLLNPPADEGKPPSFEDSVSFMRDALKKFSETEDPLERARILTAGVRYSQALALHSKLLGRLEGEEQHLLEAKKAEEVRLRTQLEASETAFEGLQPSGFLGYVARPANRLFRGKQVKSAKNVVTQAEERHNAATAEVSSAESHLAELARKKQESARLLEEYNNSRVAAVGGLIHATASTYKGVRQDLAQDDVLKQELDEALIARHITPVLDRLKSEGSIEPPTVVEYTQLIRDCLKDGFEGIYGMSDDAMLKAKERKRRLDEMKEGLSNQQKDILGRGIWAVTVRHASPQSTYDSLMSLLAGEAGRMQIEGLMKIVESSDLPDDSKKSLRQWAVDELTSPDSSLQGLAGSQLDLMKMPDALLDSALELPYYSGRWNAIRDSPVIQSLFGLDAAESLEKRISERTINELLVTREHTDRSNDLGYRLLEFRNIDSTPFMIMNFFRESGYSGEMPFISIHENDPRKTFAYEFISSLSENELSQLRQRNIPGLMEVINIVNSTSEDSDFRHDRIVNPKYARLLRAYAFIERFSEDSSLRSLDRSLQSFAELDSPEEKAEFNKTLAAACAKADLDVKEMRRIIALQPFEYGQLVANPANAELERNLGKMCAHLMAEGSDEQKIFTLGLLERLKTDLTGTYVLLGRILRDTKSGRVSGEIVRRLVERVKYQHDAQAALVLVRNTPENEAIKNPENKFLDALISVKLEDSDRAVLSGIFGFGAGEIRDVNNLVLGINEKCESEPGILQRLAVGVKEFPAWIVAAKTPGALELITELSRHGYFPEAGHGAIIPEMVQNKEQILAGVRMLSRVVNDYRYSPAKNSVYDPEKKEDVAHYTFEPYSSFAEQQGIGKLFDILSEMQKKDGKLSAEVTDGFLKSLIPPSDFTEQRSGEFNQALNTLVPAFTTPQGKLNSARSLITPAVFRLIAENPVNTTQNLLDFGVYLIEQKEALKQQPNFSFIKSEEALDRLLSNPHEALKSIRDAEYPPAFVLGVLGALKPGSITPELAGKITASLPRGCLAVKDKYNLEYMTSYVHENPEIQVPILQGVVEQFKLERDESASLIGIMSFANSLSEVDFQKRIMSELEKKHKTFQEFASAVNKQAVEVMSDRYPAELLAKQPIEKLNRWLSVYSIYEKTLKHFNHPQNIPVMRVLAVVELLGEDEKFKRNDPELMQQLVSQANTLFPKEDERKAALEYLEARMKADEVKKVFPEDKYSDADRTRLLGVWSDRTHMRPHTLSDVCIDDRLESVHNVLDDLFHKRHFSPALQALESLNPEAQNPMQSLADSWRALNLALAQISGADEQARGRRQPKTDPKMQIAADRIKSETAHMSKEEQVEELKRLQRSVEEEQERLKAWSGIRSLGFKYEGKMDGLSEKLASCREKLGEHAPLIEGLGFRFDQSFRKKIYLGDVDMLSEAVEKSIQTKSIDEARKKELEALRGILKELKKASNDAEQYLSGLQPTLTETLSMLEFKRNKVQNLRSVIHEGDSFQDALEKVWVYDRRLAGFIQKRIQEEQTPEDARRALLNQILLAYEDSSAIADVQNIIGAVKPQEESSGAVVHNYSHEMVFSKMLEAMKGQCLDYRTSHNSIGNSVYNTSLTDPIRGLDISQDSDGRPRFDAITYLAPVEADGLQQPAIVTDPFYVPDGSVTSWSKIEGHVMYLIEKADRMGIPLVIPESHISSNMQLFEGMQAEENLKFEKKTVKVTLLPGATGETYCEMTGYVHYSQETALEIQAYVYTPKAKAA